jgi:uncharacterized membrane protein
VALKAFDLVSIVLAALVFGVFWGPWVALSRSMKTFPPDVFLAIVQRMKRNLEPVMTVLMPLALLSIIPVLVLSYGNRPEAFYSALSTFALFVVALVVTTVVEVPIVKEVANWTISTMPGHWEQRRDRWVSFHTIRIVAGLGGLVLLLVGTIF